MKYKPNPSDIVTGILALTNPTAPLELPSDQVLYDALGGLQDAYKDILPFDDTKLQNSGYYSKKLEATLQAMCFHSNFMRLPSGRYVVDAKTKQGWAEDIAKNIDLSPQQHARLKIASSEFYKLVSCAV
jgi:organic radical activating enzyme